MNVSTFGEHRASEVMTLLLFMIMSSLVQCHVERVNQIKTKKRRSTFGTQVPHTIFFCSIMLFCLIVKGNFSILSQSQPTLFD